VGVHSTRPRKTGPCVPVTVARCHRHEIYFTVYPPGHVPYGRAAVLPLDLAGHRVDALNEESFATADTQWQAVADAAAGARCLGAQIAISAHNWRVPADSRFPMSQFKRSRATRSRIYSCYAKKEEKMMT